MATRLLAAAIEPILGMGAMFENRTGVDGVAARLAPLPSMMCGKARRASAASLRPPPHFLAPDLRCGSSPQGRL